MPRRRRGPQPRPKDAALSPRRGDALFAPEGRKPRRRRGPPFRIHRKCCFLQRRCNCAFGDHIFSLLREKIWKKRARDAFYSADARKNNSFRCAYFRYTVRNPNALRATVQSGFLSARYTVRGVRLAPAEYLTYEIRDLSNLMKCRGGRPCPPAAPQARDVFSYSPQCRYDCATATVAPRAHFFLSCQKKVCKKEALDAFYSADARKNNSFRCAYFRYTVRNPNALTGDRRIGFPERTIYCAGR